MSTDKIRIDKWLWTMRIFKTRSIAADACKRSNIKVNGTLAKSSRNVSVGDTIVIDFKNYERTIKIVQLSNNRVSAKVLADFIKDLTPPSEYQKQKDYNASKQPLYFITEKPAKKNRC